MRVSASALLLAGAAAAAPSSMVLRNEQTCTQKALHTKQWTVKDFDFHASYIFTTPAHQNAWGYVNFTLENPSVDFTARCEASSSQLSDFFYGNFIYNCTQPAGSNSEATFTFSRPQNQVKINQTWACPQEGSRFWAEGGANLTLDCKDDTWKNPEWKMGQIYSSRTITCNHIDAPVTIESMRAVA
ncbi:hypothetical protein QQS21_007774 [Conoideocrella luteorostrata]|uniref:AA1-like domain-containing protein n=1 Tax=Conoideocrella luteorostrata TaxID=1105319 RepID=A0AAJ0FX30_9HYPO|nr:hypothetical protein QQS21_007774 [Conoideocrella luteorostrata]